MNVRENRGLQLALILFVTITVVLAISTYIYFQQFQAEKAKIGPLTERVRELESQQQHLARDSRTLKMLIGAYRDNVPIEDIEQDHALDTLDVFAGDESVDDPSYRRMVSHLARAIRIVAQHEAAALKYRDQKEEELARQKNVHLAELDIYRRNRLELEGNLKHHRQRAAADEVVYIERTNHLVKLLDSKGRLVAAWEEKYDDMEKSLSQDVQRARDLYGMIRNKWEATQAESFEQPDGRIATVNGRSRTCTIDLGYDDLLRRGLTFTVYDAREDGLKGPKRKGTIEVTRILEGHLAEARIVEDSIKNLILPGDKIFTPLWQPGKKRHFALAGLIDIDGDGDSDRKKVHNLIAQSGGVIDAEVTDAGRRTGKMTVDTRYLIVGKQPTDADSLRAMKRILDEAERLGIDQISVDKFLDLVGYRPPSEVVQLTGDAPPREFRRREMPRPDSAY